MVLQLNNDTTIVMVEINGKVSHFEFPMVGVFYPHSFSRKNRKNGVQEITIKSLTKPRIALKKHGFKGFSVDFRSVYELTHINTPLDIEGKDRNIVYS